MAQSFWGRLGDAFLHTGSVIVGGNVREVDSIIAARNAEAAKTTFDKKLSAAEKAIADLEAKENELLAIVYGKSSKEPIAPGADGGGGTTGGSGGDGGAEARTESPTAGRWTETSHSCVSGRSFASVMRRGSSRTRANLRKRSRNWNCYTWNAAA